MELSGLARIVFQSELGSMQLNLAGCAEGLDPVHLHDLRVAERRTRAALSEFKGFLPEPLLQEFQEHFRWLHQITNPVRDLDVGISHFPYYRRKISPGRRRDLQPALVMLQSQRREAQRQLAEILESGRLDDILQAWSDRLEEGFTLNNQESHQSAAEYGCQRICRRFHTIRDKALAIHPGSPPWEFHSLRIRVKKLRYQIEFYNLVLGQRRISRLLKRFKKFQDILGRLQDAVVQVEYIHQLADDLIRSGIASGTQAALEQLIASYQKQITVCVEQSFKQVHWLTSSRTARIFQRGFGCSPSLLEADLL